MSDLTEDERKTFRETVERLVKDRNITPAQAARVALRELEIARARVGKTPTS